ncbi:hypothetical protein [Nonomuraea helvata]|uniref:Uncharacterized protein n=1 Tax=Nonomuraea helvata TaxID=37484 RepID=A0ABV5S5X9_9ACTN
MPANRGSQWPAGANTGPGKPLYSRPGVLQTSAPQQETDESEDSR